MDQVKSHGVRFTAFTTGKQKTTGILEFLTHLVIAVVAYIAVLIPFYFLVATRFEEMGVQFNVSDTVKTFVGMGTRMLDPVEKMRILESMQKPKRHSKERAKGDSKGIEALDKKVEASNAVVRRYAYVKLAQVLVGGAVMVAILYYFTQRSYRSDLQSMPDAHKPESIGSMIRSNAVLALVILVTQTLFSLGFATWVRIVDKSELTRRSIEYVQDWADESEIRGNSRSSGSVSSPPPTLAGMRSGSSGQEYDSFGGQGLRRRVGLRQ